MKYTKLLWVADITFGKEARAQEKPIREGPTLSPGHNTYTARAIYDSDTTSIITPCSATTHNPEHKDITAEIPDRWYISQIVAVSVMWSGLGGIGHQQNIKGQNRYVCQGHYCPWILPESKHKRFLWVKTSVIVLQFVLRIFRVSVQDIWEVEVDCILLHPLTHQPTNQHRTVSFKTIIIVIMITNLQFSSPSTSSLSFIKRLQRHKCCSS